MLKIKCCIKKMMFLLLCMMFGAHLAVAMFMFGRQKPVIRKTSTYAALRPVLEKEKEKAKAALAGGKGNGGELFGQILRVQRKNHPRRNFC